jgi:hypothetical protein
LQKCSKFKSSLVEDLVKNRILSTDVISGSSDSEIFVSETNSRYLGQAKFSYNGTIDAGAKSQGSIGKRSKTSSDNSSELGSLKKHKLTMPYNTPILKLQNSGKRRDNLSPSNRSLKKMSGNHGS